MRILRLALCVTTALAMLGGSSVAAAVQLEVDAPEPAGGLEPAVLVDQVIFADGFESQSGFWNFGEEGWGRTAYRSKSGAASAYCAQAWIDAPGPYPDLWTEMVAGPFDLSSFESARLDFELWLDCDPEWDEVYVYATTGWGEPAGVSFSWAGGGWQSESLDVSYCAGETEVWLVFEFYGFESFSQEGAYIDDVQLVGKKLNQLPTTWQDSYSTEQDIPLSVPAPGVLQNDRDADGDPITAHLSVAPTHGELVFAENGSFTYTPAPGFLGADSFMYYATDSWGESSLPCQVLVNVQEIVPHGIGDTYSVRTGTSLSVSAPGVLANDSDRLGRTLTAVQTQPAVHGTATLLADGSLTYTPDVGYVGWDWFAYRAVADPGVLSDFIGVQIFVAPEPVEWVSRFYNRVAGTHFYTKDPQEQVTIMQTRSHIYTYEGTAYTLNPERNDTPLHRFYRPASGTHFYTADQAECTRVRQTMTATYTYEGIAYNVSADSAGGSKVPVHRFYNRRNGTHFYTADAAEMQNVKTNLSNVYSYDGIAFYLGQ